MPKRSWKELGFVPDSEDDTDSNDENNTSVVDQLASSNSHDLSVTEQAGGTYGCLVIVRAPSVRPCASMSS
jgi:hypothetical protein